MKITKNFSLNEFTRSATADKLGIDNSLPLDGISDLYIKNLVVHLLQPLRNALNQQIKINSGYRCSELNTAVSGAKNSHHMLGTCADITLGSIEKNKLAFDWIKDNCNFRQLIWEKGGQWIHVEYLESDNKKQILNIG